MTMDYYSWAHEKNKSWKNHINAISHWKQREKNENFFKFFQIYLFLMENRVIKKYFFERKKS